MTYFIVDAFRTRLDLQSTRLRFIGFNKLIFIFARTILTNTKWWTPWNCECITSITQNTQFIVFDILTRCRKAINLVFTCSNIHVMACEEGFLLASSIRCAVMTVYASVATNIYPVKLNYRLNNLFGLQNKWHSF